MHIAILGAASSRSLVPLRPFRDRLHPWQVMEGRSGWSLLGMDAQTRDAERAQVLLAELFEADADVHVHVLEQPRSVSKSAEAWAACFPELAARGVRVVGVWQRAKLDRAGFAVLATAAEQHGLWVLGQGMSLPPSVVRVASSRGVPPGQLVYIDPADSPYDPQVGALVGGGEPLALAFASAVRICRGAPDSDIAQWTATLCAEHRGRLQLSFREAVVRLPTERSAQLAHRIALRLLHHYAEELGQERVKKLHKSLADTMRGTYVDGFATAAARALDEIGQTTAAQAFGELHGLGALGGLGDERRVDAIAAHARDVLPEGEVTLQRLDLDAPLHRSAGGMSVDHASLRELLARVHSALASTDAEYLARLSGARGKKVPEPPAQNTRSDALAHQFAAWAAFLHGAQRSTTFATLVVAIVHHMRDLFGDLDAPSPPALRPE